ncbi:helix-turn-helix domain-containing protein [Hydrogenophaga sp.]|uniref:helix-turn-helix domain-containing protein n=1 Tax=Hydrogenophaga sp. TaxID=1904254 RepID=UPI0035AFB644
MITPASNPTPGDQRLTLIERARHAVLEAGETAPTPWLAPAIERSWRRCLAMGQRPQQRVEFEPVSPGDIRIAQDASRPLLQAASPVVRTLSRAMVHSRYFAILTDARGTVIEVDGPVDRSNPKAAAIARVGVDLSEAAVGTTAIGTTLTDLEPVWLHRGEHFFRDTGMFSCAGAPIWGPDGHCVGMLDLTGIDVTEQPALKHLVTQSARSIENALTTSRPHRLLLRLNWPGRVLGDDNDGLVCVDGDGGITGANRAAADMLGLVPRQGTMHCADLFAIPTDSLFDAARQHRPAFEVPLWSGLRLQLLAQGPGRVCGAARPSSHSMPLKDVEAALIRRAVEDARGNVMEAARALGISRATVYRKLTRKKA